MTLENKLKPEIQWQNNQEVTIKKNYSINLILTAIN